MRDGKICVLPQGGAFAGDVTPQEAWEWLSKYPQSMLVDVRTQAEWQLVGTPDLRNAKGKLALVSWKFYPQFTLNPDFAVQLETAGATPDMHLYFLCRSGGRSTDAAIAMTTRGYAHCYNIAGGFEGKPNAQGHRGTTDGWKAAQLPWGQS